MITNLRKELQVFKTQPHNMRVLLMTNMLFALVLPVVEIFVGAYIMRNTNSPKFVAMYQLAMYVGLILTSMVNGALLKYMSVKLLYCLGILIVGISMFGMMILTQLTIIELLIAGIAMGAAAGFFWTNRYLLALNATTDNNRNYFFGLESFFFTVSSIIVPLGIGTLLAGMQGKEVLGWTIDISRAYQIVTVIVVLITILAVSVLMRGTFKVTPPTQLFYRKFHKLWNSQMLLAGLKGLVQGFLVTAPAILVMKFVGEEGELGVIQGVSGVFTAILVYVLGRTTKPKHRNTVFAVGLIIFFLGTLSNGILFSAVGVITFVLCKVIFQPLHDLAYFPIMMRVIDVVSKIEKRNEYVYVLNHEFGLFWGRALGLLLFIGLSHFVSEVFALKYALIIVAVIQLLSIPLAKYIVRECDKDGRDEERKE